MAARARKHVLCEKPLALSVADVDAMAAACRESGVVLAEAFMYRHHPQTLKVKELLDAGTIGTLRYLRGSFTFPLTRPNDVRLRPEWGGGCLWDIGCYPLSFARLLVGKEPLEAFGSQVLGPTGIDESFAGQLVFPGDVLFQLDAGFRSPVRAEMELVGTEGLIRVHHPWRPEPDHPVLLTREGRTEAIPVPEVDRFLLEIEDLADAARGRKPPRMSLADSRANVAALVALQRSARERRPIRVEAEAA
jgi:predicted dehydrogenase